MSVLLYTCLDNPEIPWNLFAHQTALKEVESSPVFSSLFVAVQLLGLVIFQSFPDVLSFKLFFFLAQLFSVLCLFRVHTGNGKSCEPGVSPRLQLQKPGCQTHAQAPFRRHLWPGLRQRESWKTAPTSFRCWRVFQSAPTYVLD